MLAAYPWPGNVRELKNVLESLVIFHQTDTISAAELPADLRRKGGGAADGGSVQCRTGEPRTMGEIERRAILETLELTGGRRADAARILQIGLRTLQRKLKDYKQEGFYEG